MANSGMHPPQEQKAHVENIIRELAQELQKLETTTLSNKHANFLKQLLQDFRNLAARKDNPQNGDLAKLQNIQRALQDINKEVKAIQVPAPNPLTISTSSRNSNQDEESNEENSDSEEEALLSSPKSFHNENNNDDDDDVEKRTLNEYDGSIVLASNNLFQPATVIKPPVKTKTTTKTTRPNITVKNPNSGTASKPATTTTTTSTISNSSTTTTANPAPVTASSPVSTTTTSTISNPTTATTTSSAPATSSNPVTTTTTSSATPTNPSTPAPGTSKNAPMPSNSLQLDTLLEEMKALRDQVADEFHSRVPFKKSRLLRVLDNQLMVLQSAAYNPNIQNLLPQLEEKLNDAVELMQEQFKHVMERESEALGEFAVKYAQAIVILQKYKTAGLIAAPRGVETQKINQQVILDEVKLSGKNPNETDEAAFQRYFLDRFGGDPREDNLAIYAGHKTSYMNENFLKGELYVSQIEATAVGDKPFVMATSRTENLIQTKTYQVPDSLDPQKAWVATCSAYGDDVKNLYKNLLPQLGPYGTNKDMEKLLRSALTQQGADEQLLTTLMNNFRNTYQGYNKKNELPHDDLLKYAIAVIDTLQGKKPIVIRGAFSEEQVAAVMMVAMDRGYERKDIQVHSANFRNVTINERTVKRFHQYAMLNKESLGYEPLKESENKATEVSTHGHAYYRPRN